jgi:hypothetical protein
MFARPRLLVLTLATLAACSRGPGRLAPPAIDADAAAEAALQALDRNGDAKLDHAELAECPAILGAISKYDADADGFVVTDELARRIRSWSSERTAMTSYFCRVYWNGSPLPGAKVEFIPESFLGSAIKPATGQTKSSGHANLEIAAADLPTDLRISGVHLGLYKVRITHPTIQIPKRYNEATTLGHEVTLSRDSAGPAEFKLTKD